MSYREYAREMRRNWKRQLRDIFDSLRGVENALPAKELVDHLDTMEMHDTCPMIRKLIRELIEDGEPIASCKEGYYRISTKVELDDYLESLQSRCDGIHERIVNVTNAYTSELNSRHLNARIPMKDRCRYYAIYLAETLHLPYQALYAMAYRKVSKITGLDLANLPSHYRGSVLNYISNNNSLGVLYDVLEELEEVLV